MIQQLADWITYDLLGLDATSHLGVALDFFIYDTVKILMLLFTISSLMGVVNAYFPIERLRNYLMTHRLHGMQYLLASVFGAITPFCSCSSIPLFIGFVKGGIPLGVTFAFLITSPLVNEVAVAMFLGSFGMKVTVIYVVSGVLLGMIGGVLLGRMRLEPLLSEWVKQTQKRSTQQTEAWETDHVSFIHRLPAIIREAWGIVRSVLIYVIIGIGIGAMMHGYVPEGFFEVHSSPCGSTGSSYVCQCCGYCAHHRSLRGQRHPAWHRHCLHDGRRGVVATRSHTTQEGYDMAPHWCVFWHHHTVHRLTGLSFQLHLMRVFARGTGK